MMIFEKIYRGGLGEPAFLSWGGPGDHALKKFWTDQVIVHSLKLYFCQKIVSTTKKSTANIKFLRRAWSFDVFRVHFRLVLIIIFERSFIWFLQLFLSAWSPGPLHDKKIQAHVVHLYKVAVYSVTMGWLCCSVTFIMITSIHHMFWFNKSTF